MAKKKCVDIDITDLSVDWGSYSGESGNPDNGLPYSGAKVQDFIKSQLSELTSQKVGWYRISNDVFNLDEENYLYAFANEVSCAKYFGENGTYDQTTDPDNLLICRTVVPRGSVNAKKYYADMKVYGPTSFYDIQHTGVTYVQITTQSQAPGQTDWESYSEFGTLTVGIRGENYKETYPLVESVVTLDEATAIPVSLANFYRPNKGIVQVTISWTGIDSKVNAQTTISVGTTNFELTTKDEDGNYLVDYTKLYEPNAIAKFTFGTKTSIDKKLYMHLESIPSGASMPAEQQETQNDEVQKYHYKQDLSSQADRGSIEFVPTVEGRYVAKFWMVSSASNIQVKSNPVIVDFIVCSVDNNKALQVVVNDRVDGINNWEKQDIGTYTFYGAGTSSLRFVFWDKNYSSTPLFEVVEANKLPTTLHTLTVSPECRNIVEDQTVHMRVYNSNKIDGNITTGTTYLEEVDFTLVKTTDYSATDIEHQDTSFVLNPKSRGNDNDKENVYNTASSTRVAVTKSWENMDWLNGGWVSDDEGEKCLFIPAGSKLTLSNLNIFDANTLTNNVGTTIEIDFAYKNCSDSTKAVLSMSTLRDGLNRGFTMFPDTATLVHASTLAEAMGDTEIAYCENKRTHVAVNITPSYNIKYPLYNVANQTKEVSMRLARVFVNGVINREISCEGTSFDVVKNIVIGSDSCDTYIYGIKIIQNQALTTLDIMKDYKATLPTVAEKQSFEALNAITDSNGNILYSEAKQKYNCIVCYMKDKKIPGKRWGYDKNNNDAHDCNLLVTYVNKNVNGEYSFDTQNSFYLENANIKGQGSSSMSYYKWNIDVRFKDSGATSYHGVDSTGAVINTPTENHQYVQKFDEAGNPFTRKITKMVGKLNYASSMQSHKMGALNMYEALKAKMGIKSAIQETDSLCRTSVYEDPFLYFIGDPTKGDDSIEFYGFLTFGAGKGDKATYGIDLVKKDTVWVGGNDQTQYLTLCFAPWLDKGDDIVTYSNEKYMYAGQKSFDFEMGLDAMHDNADNDKHMPIDVFRDFWNFMFTHSTRLKACDGTEISSWTEKTLAKSGATHTTNQYWLTQNATIDGVSYNKYDVLRFDWKNSKWVKAGVKTSAVAGHNYSEAEADTMNLLTQCNGVQVNLSGISYTIGSSDIDSLSDDAKNTIFRRARAKLLRENLGNYADVDDILMTFAYTYFLAASDNLAKNSYWYVDKEKNGKKLIRMWRDDDDTIFAINNVGLKEKPYWVELHDLKTNINITADKNPEDNTYFTASYSAYYSTLYYAFHQALVDEASETEVGITKINLPSKTLRGTMQSMLLAMQSLGEKYVLSDNMASPVLGCVNKYFFETQRYFPAIAYNEAAKSLYEEVTAALKDGVNEYASEYTSNALGMSLGNYLEGEIWFMKQRCQYLTEFSMITSLLTKVGGQFRQPDILTVKAGTYCYVYATLNAQGDLATSYPTRLSPNQETQVRINGSGEGVASMLCGIDGLSSIGNWKDIEYSKTNQSFGFKSENVTEFKAGDVYTTPLFNPSTINALPSVIETLDLRNVSSITTMGDLSSYIRLKNLYLSGTKIAEIALPQSWNLQTLTLPTTLKTVTLNPIPHVNTQNLGLQSMSGLTTINITASVDIANKNGNDFYGTTSAWLGQWYNMHKDNGTSMGDLNVSIEGIYWDDATVDFLNVIAEMKTNLGDRFNMRGIIELASGQNLDGQTYNKIQEVFGRDAFQASSKLRFVTKANFANVEGDNSTPVENAIHTYTSFEAKGGIKTERTFRLYTLGYDVDKTKQIVWTLTGDDSIIIKSQSNDGCTIEFAEINSSATTAVLSAQFYVTDGSIKNATSANIVNMAYTYPTAETIVINGKHNYDVASQGGETVYNQYQLSGSSYTAELDTTGTKTGHGYYSAQWGIVKDESVDDDYNLRIATQINDSIYVNSERLNDICVVNNIKCTITTPNGSFEKSRTVYVGYKPYDTFGWIYANDGVLYPTQEDITNGSIPVGIVVVPARHTSDSTSRVMSLNEMSLLDPDNGTSGTTREGIMWGGYTYQTPLDDITAVPNITGGTNWIAFFGSETNYNGNLRFLNNNDDYGMHKSGDEADGLYYYSESADDMKWGTYYTNKTESIKYLLPSPFKKNSDLFNSDYAKSGTATADLNGKTNTQTIIEGATAQENWLSDVILNKQDEGYYPAACCCYRYHVQMKDESLNGNKSGDWYLPAAGELGYIIPRFAKLNAILNNLCTAGYKALPLSANRSYWSSSEYSSTNAWYVNTANGNVSNPNKYNCFYVRAFLSVG